MYSHGQGPPALSSPVMTPALLMSDAHSDQRNLSINLIQNIQWLVAAPAWKRCCATRAKEEHVVSSFGEK